MNKEKLKGLSQFYTLTKDDFYVQEYRKKNGEIQKVPFMLKSGIDKIQAIENIKIDFRPLESLCKVGEYVTLKVEGKWKDKTYATIGEASTKNCKVSYLGCMAEKRGRARVILTLVGFAEKGVYSIDEKWDADELNHSK